MAGITTRIPVCYTIGSSNVVPDDPAKTNKNIESAFEFVAKVRYYVENSWGRVANIEYLGWGECGANRDNVQIINIESSGGSWSAGNTISLEWTDGRQPYVTVHEFGHALGFAHEFVRQDWACMIGSEGCLSCSKDADCSGSQYGQSCINGFCQDYTNGSSGILSSPGVADYESVLATTYVHNRIDRTNDKGVADPVNSLSAYDVVGVQNKYGRKPAGSIVGLGGRCLNISTGTVNWGNAMIAWPCTNQGNDTWFYDPSARTLQSQQNANICMNIQGGGVNPGGATSLISWGCNTEANEKFGFDGVQIRAMGNMCLAAQSSTDGSTVDLRRCNAIPSMEKWNIVPRPVSSNDLVSYQTGFQLAGTDLCLAAESVDYGASIVLRPCSTYASSQTFSTQGGVISRWDNSSRCFNVLGGTDIEGQMLGMWDGCSPSIPNAFFYLSGAIKGMGHCLDMSGGVSYGGTPITMYPCNAGQNQEWDYYWP